MGRGAWSVEAFYEAEEKGKDDTKEEGKEGKAVGCFTVWGVKKLHISRSETDVRMLSSGSGAVAEMN